MSLENFADYKRKVVEGGNYHTSTFRKTSASATTAGIWCDMSTMPGNPVTNFYASTPLVGAALSSREGIPFGSDQSPQVKYLKKMLAIGPVAPTNLLLLDYLKYYPFVDGDSTDEQFFDNSVPLPRYQNGKDVKAFVVAQGAYVGGAQFFINYTNQDGVSGRISNNCTSNTATTSGSLISSGVTAGTFGWSIPLLQGDTGIRSVESFTFLSANGGIFALVLAAELGLVAIKEANVPAEKDFLTDTGFSMPVIKDGAYLNFIALSNSTIAAQPFYGYLHTVWG